MFHNTYVWFDDQEIAQFKSCNPYITRYIAVSENVAGYTIEKFGIPREKVQVISNGLDLLKHHAMMKKAEILSRANLGIGEEDFLFSQYCLLYRRTKGTSCPAQCAAKSEKGTVRVESALCGKHR